MKIIDYKKLVKLPADSLFSTINKMNELGEVLVVGEYPDGRRFIYSPLGDVSHAGSREIDFDENTFNRTGSFVLYEPQEIQGMIEKLEGILDFAPEQVSSEASSVKSVVLKPESTAEDRVPIIPVFKTESAQYFVDAALVTPRYIEFGSGETAMTAPYAIGAEFSLLGISQTIRSIEQGLHDMTDVIDPAMVLKRIYLHLEASGQEAEVIAVDVSHGATAKAHFEPQGSYRNMRVLFSENVGLVAGHTTVKGVPSKILTQGWVANVAVSGNVNLELASTRFLAQRIESFPQVDAMTRTLVRVRVVGYELQSYRTNPNRRPIRQAA